MTSGILIDLLHELVYAIHDGTCDTEWANIMHREIETLRFRRKPEVADGEEKSPPYEKLCGICTRPPKDCICEIRSEDCRADAESEERDKNGLDATDAPPWDDN